MIEDLTAQRTAALRALLAGNADVALATVVHAMALPLFYDRYGGNNSLSLAIETSDLCRSAKGIDDTPAVRSLAEQEGQWRQRLPETSEALWAWCLSQDTDTRLALLSFCAACSVDAVRRPHHHAEARIAHADRLATALSLDMREWWQPTSGNYLARVPKQRVLEAVAEGVSAEAADNFRKLKKDTLISHAEERLAGSGWLPAPLRAPIQTQEIEPPLAAE